MANKKKKFYITTAIDYPNAKPHIGHAYERITADVVARWHRLLSEEVFFSIGNDEHGLKIQRVAEQKGITPQKFVDALAIDFINLWKKLNISNDIFIRTTSPKHVETCQSIFQKVYDKGDIYKGFYEGYYCTDCETFYLLKDLVEGKCPVHNKLLETIKEESYFFRLSKYQQKIIEHIQNNKEFVQPNSKRNEILNRLKEPLKDLSVSRCSFKWGIPLPNDKKHVIYVWFDALLNYISAVNYPTGKFKRFWPADIHFIGKDILWFHAVIWPAILFAAGIQLPKKIFAHGFVNVKGIKISKSLGNIVDPVYLAEKYGVDALRYFLVREIPFGEDGDFSEDALCERYNSELADKLGNLVSRVAALAEKYGQEKCENRLLNKLKIQEIKKVIDGFELDKALNLIFEFVDKCNEYVQENKIWETGDKKKIYELADSIKAIAILLWPFIPSSCEKIAKQIGFGIKSLKQISIPLEEKTRIKKGEILFKKTR